ncbi:MAG: hypothetical protein CFE29_29385 [Bradyrhizobiaceae bacterium PARB1]|nr:MAG: hypothetical protein CFE29_29385 [Bradyrhizobiaceae bacterium PARB1]
MESARIEPVRDRRKRRDTNDDAEAQALGKACSDVLLHAVGQENETVEPGQACDQPRVGDRAEQRTLCDETRAPGAEPVDQRRIARQVGEAVEDEDRIGIEIGNDRCDLFDAIAVGDVAVWQDRPADIDGIAAVVRRKLPDRPVPAERRQRFPDDTRVAALIERGADGQQPGKTRLPCPIVVSACDVQGS